MNNINGKDICSNNKYCSRKLKIAATSHTHIPIPAKNCHPPKEVDVENEEVEDHGESHGSRSQMLTPGGITNRDWFPDTVE